MSILKNELRDFYAQIPNELVSDTSISCGAFRLIAYLYTKRNDWTVHNNEIKKSLCIKSNNTLSKYWQELLASGWLSRHKQRDKNGKIRGGYEYTLINHITKDRESGINDKNGCQKNHITNNTKSGNVSKLNKTKKDNNTNKDNKTEIKQQLQTATAPMLAEAEPVKTSVLVWQAYKQAYYQRYGADPVRNAMVNGQIANFVKRVPEDEAPNIAAYYVTSNNSYYAGRGHSVGILLSDAEKLCTEYRTGNRQTQTRVRQQDKTQSNYDAIQEAKLILKGMNNE